MEKEFVIRKLQESGVVAVIRANDEESALEIARKCIESGITALEITFTVPNACSVIEKLAVETDSDILIGAGTVLDVKAAKNAINAGAEFIVSPHFDRQIVQFCSVSDVLAIPGIMTVTEAVTAHKAGAEIVKLFPAELFGPAFIKAIKGPLPDIKILPTGGIDVGNTAEWIRAGAIAVGAGTSLTRGDVKENARLFLEAMRVGRGG